ncbi:hypothetical protein JCM15519_09960 [Fundidesulfovibrio butyratiphilus]
MRKAKREIKDKSLVEALLRRCRILHLALWDGERPYAVTVNFGYAEGAVFFHCAPEGRKIECLRKNGLVSFQAVAEYELVRQVKGCGYTTHYKSISGFGTACELADPAEKTAALNVIMAQHEGPTGEYPPEVLERTAVVRIDVREMTGKSNPAPE